MIRNCDIIRVCEKLKPFTPRAVLQAGLPLSYIGEGSYREVYGIVGTNWVIKLPLTEWDPERYSKLVDWLHKHRIHAHHEMNAYWRIQENSKMRALRKFVPKMLWYDWNTGVIVQERCDELRNTDDNAILCQELHYEFHKHFKRHTDIATTNNVGRNSKGQLKVIDMGLLELNEASTQS